MNQYLINENVLVTVLQYLKKRPYDEVSAAIVILEGLPKHEPKEDKKEAKKA